MFVKINGERHYLWRAVDHEGEVLESFVTKTRDKKAALKFLKKAMKKHGRAGLFVTDKLRSYGAALKELGVGPSGDWALAEQPGGELAPAVPTTGARDAPVPAHAKSAEIRLRPRLRHQPLQHRAQPLQQTPLQGQPRRRSRRVARSMRGIRDSRTALGETWFESV
jgi:transposase-like protein